MTSNCYLCSLKVLPFSLIHNGTNPLPIAGATIIGYWGIVAVAESVYAIQYWAFLQGLAALPGMILIDKMKEEDELRG